MWQRKSTTPGPSYSATSTDAQRPTKRYTTKRLSDPSWNMRQQYGIRPQRRTSDLWRMCSVKLPTSRRVTTVDPADCVTTMIESMNRVTLVSRWAEAKLVILYRIAHNIVYVTTSSLTAAPTHTRGNTSCYLQPSTRIEAYKHSFSSTIKSWNKCTQQSVTKQSLDSFRRHLHSMPT